MGIVGFELDPDGLDEAIEVFSMVQKTFPKEVKKFMQSEGNKLKRRTLKGVKSSTLGKITGNYEKGIKRGRPYTYDLTGVYSIRVYSNAPHAHLIEDGHEIYVDGVPTGKYTREFHLFRRAAEEFESTYETDTEKFALKIVEPLNKG